MHPNLSKIITRNSKNKVTISDVPPTRYQLAKQFRYSRIAVKRLIKDSIYIILGITAAAFGLQSFLLPKKFIDGGATGVALIISDLTPFSFSLVLVVINIPFIILGSKLIGKEFALKAFLAISTLAIVTTAVHFPDVTHHKFLVAFF